MSAMAIVSTATPAHAAFKLLITDGTNTVIIQDQGSGDANSTVGKIGAVGLTVGNFEVDVVGGISKPAASGILPHQDLNFQVSSTGSGGTLAMLLTDTDYVQSPEAIAGSIGGTLGVGATLTAGAYLDGTNTEFGANPPGLQFLLGPFGPGGAYSGHANGPQQTFGAPYSMTQLIILTHGDAGQGSIFSSGNFEVTDPVPEPGSMTLFGTGLIAVASRLRRRFQK